MNERRSLIIRISGPKACFRRPEFADDFVSYDVMPPLTVLRMANRAYPPISGEWRLRRLTVVNCIQFGWDCITTARGKRRALLLHDVAYVAELVGNEAGFAAGAISLSAAEPAKRSHLGLPEFDADLKMVMESDLAYSALQGTGTRDLGWLPEQYLGGRIRYLRTTMTDGVIDMTEQDRNFSGV